MFRINPRVNIEIANAVVLHADAMRMMEAESHRRDGKPPLWVVDVVMQDSSGRWRIHLRPYTEPSVDRCGGGGQVHYEPGPHVGRPPKGNEPTTACPGCPDCTKKENTP